ncbi:MAG: lamin tail domain-containing protein [Oryzihumus sp.]
MLQAGQAIPLNIPPETGRWKPYSAAAQEAAKKGQALWNPVYCGSGPQQGNPIRLWVNYDGDGDESTNPNAEYVRILNGGTTRLAIGGWWVRTGAPDSYRFPEHSSIAPGSYITLHVGKGIPTGTNFYWGSTWPKFGNVDVGAPGNGAHLFDPQGDVRAHAIYPCRVAGTDARKGNVRVTADPVREVITLTNTAATRTDLSFLVVSVGGSTYELPRTRLDPGASVRVHTGTGHNTSTDYYWGRSSHLLVDSGGRVLLRTAEDIRLGCDGWGNVGCPNPL